MCGRRQSWLTLGSTAYHGKRLARRQRCRSVVALEGELTKLKGELRGNGGNGN